MTEAQLPLPAPGRTFFLLSPGMRPWLRRVAAAAALLALAAGLLVLMRAHVAETVTVSSDSMLPTLQRGDTVVLDKLFPRLRPLRRGELIVFCSPEDDAMVLKRVVALGGDTVEVRDAVLFVNGSAVPEPYVDLAAFDGTYFGPVTVAAERVFVLGDNRANSIDSRTYGAVEVDEVVGRVVTSFH